MSIPPGATSETSTPSLSRVSICTDRTSPWTAHFESTYALMYGTATSPSSDPMTTRCPPPVRRNAFSADRVTDTVPSTLVSTTDDMRSGGTSSKSP